MDVMFVPKLVTTLHGYTRRQFADDAIAGVIVGIVALPLSIAFAIASGVSPERGLWTAIVAGFLISLFGGSRVQIGGPTGAFVVIVYGIVQKYGIDGLTAATLMAGVILIVMGVARLGSMIEYVPHPLITGFTSGIAVIIFSGEIKDLLGLHMGAVPPGFIDKWTAYLFHAAAPAPATMVISALTFAIVILWPRVSKRLPAPFVALIVTTLIVRLMHLDVETIGSRFGVITAALPHPTLPHLHISELSALVGPAFTIAVLAAIESLLSAVVSDGMIGGRHRSNMELVAQGVANLATPLFGGIPATGAIARTATNVKNGGRTPVAGIVHAATLLVFTLFAARWAAFIPMATLAAILVVVAYHMSEWRAFMSELRSPKSDVAVLLTTFLLTVFVDLTVALAVGMVLAAFLFMRRMASITNIALVPEDEVDDVALYDRDTSERRAAPRDVDIYEVNGPFFFGAAAAFKDTVGRIAGRPRALVIRMRNVPFIDSSGMRALADVVRRTSNDGTRVCLSEVRAEPLATLTAAGVLETIGRENVFITLEDAINAVKG